MRVLVTVECAVDTDDVPKTIRDIAQGGYLPEHRYADYDLHQIRIVNVRRKPSREAEMGGGR